MSEKIYKIETYILWLTIFLSAFFVLPSFSNPFLTPKLAILVLGSALLLLIFSLRTIIEAKLNLNLGTFDFPVIVFTSAYILSTIFRTPNKMEALFLPGTTTILICATLLYFFVNQHKEEKTILSSLLASGFFFSFSILLSSLGVFAKIPQLPLFLRSQNFTPEAGFLPSAIFLAVILPIGIGLTLSFKDFPKRLASAIATTFIFVGLIISIYKIIPGKPLSPKFPSFSVSWQIAIDSLKESPFLGVGPGNYLTAFNRFKPLSYNQTELWAVRFSTARDFYLTAITETGILGFTGLAIFIFLFSKLLKEYLKNKNLLSNFLFSLSLLSLSLLLVSFLFFPATLILITLFLILASLVGKTHKTSLSLKTESTQGQDISSRLPAFLITVPLMIISIFASFRFAKMLQAEAEFQQALNFLTKNQAKETYDTLIKSIRTNPYVDRYHLTAARVNLTLANAIVQGKTSQKQNLSDQERQAITTLIQQAINEAKAGVVLNPTRSDNWEVLGQIYRAIIPFAQSADQFAIQSYRQAIALNPIDPNLRINLGGIYYAIKDYDSAVRVFELAVSAKPDHANARYNLAIALRESGKLDQAIREMTNVVSLVKKDSQDYQIATSTLADLQNKKKGEERTGEELQPPKVEEQKIKPPLELPEESGPPESVITPTPTPTPSPGSNSVQTP